MSARAASRDAGLVGAAVVFTVAVLVHNFDHVRRGVDAVDADVFWVGTLAIVPEVVVVALVCGRHHLAPAAAAGTGLALALGYLTVHFLPERGWLSDSFASTDGVRALSWFAASFELAASLLLAAAGVAAVRAAGGLERLRATPPAVGALADGLRHPATVAMVVGNALVLAGSAAQAAA